MNYELPKLKCKRCGHKWAPRKEERPLTCPNCKSPYWDKERIRKKMKKEEIIKKYGEENYKNRLLQGQEWARTHPEESSRWGETHPETVKASGRKRCRKGGKYYERKIKYNSTGIQGQRNHIRRAHRKKWQLFKQIIAPESQMHHEWIPGTSEYRGTALVEKDQHQHGIIKVIKILEGEITLLTEEAIRMGAG